MGTLSTFAGNGVADVARLDRADAGGALARCDGGGALARCEGGTLRRCGGLVVAGGVADGVRGGGMVGRKARRAIEKFYSLHALISKS
ncbi:MAG: hypothetical protein FWD69_07065 [Polyangiaceae bacterium]|nr:hypothetical protein [Polyangiaceae bacterium]